MTENTENKTHLPKKPIVIIAIVLALSALLVTFGLIHSTNNQTPDPAQPTEQQYAQANYQVLEGRLNGVAPDDFTDEELFITNHNDLQKYIELDQEIVMVDASHKVVAELDYTAVLEKFNEDFFNSHNLAIKAHIVLAGHTEYCVQTVLQNENQAIIEINKYFYIWDDNIDAMPAPELEFVFITLDKEITSAKYDIHEIEDHMQIIEEVDAQS